MGPFELELLVPVLGGPDFRLGCSEGLFQRREAVGTSHPLGLHLAQGAFQFLKLYEG